MAKPETGTEFAFYPRTYYLINGVKTNIRYVISKMENGLRVPSRGDFLPGKFTEKEKTELEKLLIRVQSPDFKS